MANVAPEQGIRVMYSLALTDGQELPSAVAHAADVLAIRVQTIPGATAVASGDRVVIELPPMDDELQGRVLAMLAQTGAAEFRLGVPGAQRMEYLASHVRDDPRAQELGIGIKEVTWTHAASGTVFSDTLLIAHDRIEYFARAEAQSRGCWHEGQPVIADQVECRVSGRAVLEGYLSALAAEDGSLAPDSDHELVYERRVDDARVEWSAVHVDREDPLAGADLSRANVLWMEEVDRAGLRIALAADDRARVEQLSRDNPGRRLVFLVDGVVEVAAVMEEPIVAPSLGLLFDHLDSNHGRARGIALASILRSGPLTAPLIQESLESIPWAADRPRFPE